MKKVITNRARKVEVEVSELDNQIDVWVDGELRLNQRYPLLGVEDDRLLADVVAFFQKAQIVLVSESTIGFDNGWQMVKGLTPDVTMRGEPIWQHTVVVLNYEKDEILTTLEKLDRDPLLEATAAFELLKSIFA